MATAPSQVTYVTCVGQIKAELEQPQQKQVDNESIKKSIEFSFQQYPHRRHHHTIKKELQSL